MKSFISLRLAFLALLPLVSRAELIPLIGRQAGGTIGSTGGNSTSKPPAAASTATGDRQCGSSMCVSATKDGTTVSYVLESQRGTPGWMAMGFGSQMAGSEVVILWANADGSITLSQRTASGEFEPAVNPSPAQVATLSQSLSSTTANKFAFTMTAGTSSTQRIIYAYSSRNPGSAERDATLIQHTDRGTLSLDLSKSLSPDPDDADDPTPPSNSGEPELLPFQKLIVAHAIFCLVGFLLFLPAGALLARFFRTSTSKWFMGHWLIQFYIAGPIILVGFSLGVAAVSQARAIHFNDTHKRVGLILFILYIVQCSLGALIHFVKFNFGGRPPQNYLHAVVGLAIIGLALYQVRTGYRTEWETTSGREAISNAANIIWYIWVVLLPVLYLIGLAFLPKQYKQEAESRYKARMTESSENMQYRR